MKPPVVVIGRHCKTNQCWIAVRFKKTQSVAKISQSPAEERADDASIGKRVPLTASPRKFYFRHACAPLSEFSCSPRARFSLWRRIKAHRRTPRSTAKRRAPPTVERCLLPLTPDESGTRSSCRACQNGGAGPRMIRRNARNACARFRAAAATIWPPVPSPSVRFAEAPALPV
jgi:hypothetical protein